MSGRAIGYQASLVLFAVALALSAWSSLSEVAARSRAVYGTLALLALGAGLVRLITV